MFSGSTLTAYEVIAATLVPPNSKMWQRYTAVTPPGLWSAIEGVDTLQHHVAGIVQRTSLVRCGSWSSKRCSQKARQIRSRSAALFTDPPMSVLPAARAALGSRRVARFARAASPHRAAVLWFSRQPAGGSAMDAATTLLEIHSIKQSTTRGVAT